MLRKNTTKLHNKTLTEAERLKVKKFLLGKSIIQVQEGIIKADKNGTAINNARKWAEAHSEIIIRRDIGKVVFCERGVKDSLAHGFGQRKLDAVQAIPKAIKFGKIIEISDDYKGKPKKNIIIMAPIKVGNINSIIVIRLVKSIGDDTRFYVHEVFDIPINKKDSTIRPSALDLTARPQGGTVLYLNLLKNILDVK